MTVGVRQRWRAARPALPPDRRPVLPTVLAVLAVVAGTGYRLGLLLHDAPPTNSDEATMGLAALHIAQGREFPVWFYGQNYMGTLEAYLAAPVFALVGPSTLGLRLPTLALYAVFVVLAWRLTLRLTGDHWFALLVVALLALGSDRVVKNQLIAGGGYPEMNAAGVALAVLAYDLAAGRPGRRLPRWAAWGFLAGLMVWVDPLVLPYVAATGAVLLAYGRRELRGRAGALLGAAALVGAGPLLAHSLAAGRNPIAAVLAAGGSGQPAGWTDRLHGGLVLGPPLGMGFCSPSHCTPGQLWWAVALPLLLFAAALSAWRALRPPVGDLGQLPFRADDNCPRSIVATAPVGGAVRLALVAAAVATLAVYTVSSAAGRTPVESSRYLSCLLISVPALLWPLWSAARRALRPRTAGTDTTGTDTAGTDTAGTVTAGTDTAGPGLAETGTAGAGIAGAGIAGADSVRTRGGAGAGARWRGMPGIAAAVLLAATLGTAAVATAGAVDAAPTARAAEARHAELVAALRQRGVRHVYGGYWTCNRLTFATREDVLCAVVDDDLRPGHDRYLPYRRAVRQSAAPGWVAPAGSPLAAHLDERRRADPAALDLVTVPGWRIYLPRP
ncbi:hypothetical protein DER29_5446 [Micromonospora sp. M71_S20]|uniref:hypothetical protein n=1 Tax=Micromonospora sp. M71_S20 TaxID=592872 RepID=UPI000EB50B34|nr:hypothetical protein [Micromonospora sp. M71_S20]RLK12169.1 hypothetical protein DER29_5446 [Micromonospora sp. M71_S20]